MNSSMSYQLGARIKQLRNAKGWSQKDLANLIGEKSGTISTWELGTRFPGEEKLRKLVKVFNTSYDYLLGYESTDTNVPRTENFSEKELELLAKFNALPLEQQEAIRTLIEAGTQNNQGHDE